MKKLSILLFVFCLLGFSPATHAQLDKFGFSASYVNAWQQWGNTRFYRMEPVHGFSAFIIGEKYICKNASFRVNLGYQKQGYFPLIGSHMDAPRNFREGYVAHQIALDLSIKGYLGRRNNRLYLFGGMRAGQTVSSKITDGYTDVPHQLQSDNFKKTTFDALGGIGFEWKRGLFLEAEYAMGITPVFTYEETKGYNRSFSARVGYYFLRPSTCRSKHLGLMDMF